MAATYGQGSFAINLAPLILNNAITVTPTTSGTGSSTLPVVAGAVTISGLSEITGFGNATWITVEDVTNPADPVVIAGFNPAQPVPTPSSSNSTNGLGNFNIAFDPASFYMSNGTKTIEVFATDNAGSVGNVVTYTFNLQDSHLPQPPPTTAPTFSQPLAILPADIKGMLNGNPVTNLETPEFIGTTNPGVTITVFETQMGGSTFQFALPGSDINSDGSFSFLFQNPPGGSGPPIANGTFQVFVQATYIQFPGLGTTTSNTVTFTIDNTTPAAVTDFRLNPADDTGIVGDNLTADRTPHFIGTAPAGTVELVQIINFTGTLASGSASVTGVSSTTPLLVGDGVTGPGIPSGTTILNVNTNATITLSAAATSSGSQSLTATAPQNTATVGSAGTFSIQLPFTLTNGSIELGVIVIDAVSGNASGLSNPVTLTIVSVASDYNADSFSDAALFSRNTATNQGLWLVKATSVGPANPAAFWFTSGTAFGPSSVTPFQGDFDGDGFTDLAYYQSSTATWFMFDSKANAMSSFALGTPNVSLPVVGYFNANAPEEAAVFTNGVWTIANGRTVTFGQAGDIPVPGDYTGVGFDELAVYRPSTGQFLVQVPGTTPTTKMIPIPGIGGGTPNVPVPGAYDNQAYFNAGTAERDRAGGLQPEHRGLHDPRAAVCGTAQWCSLHRDIQSERYPGPRRLPGRWVNPAGGVPPQ